MTSEINAFSLLPDETLAGLAENGDINAETMLLERYKETVKITAAVFANDYLLKNSVFSLGSDDLIQEGLLGLKSAIGTYLPEKNTSFRTYASKCISNAMLCAIKAATRKKNSPPGGIVSIDNIEITSGFSPEEKFISEEETNTIRMFLRNELSGLESSVIRLHLEGESYKEIAEKLQITEKAVDNAIQRVRNKLSRFLSDNRS